MTNHRVKAVVTPFDTVSYRKCLVIQAASLEGHYVEMVLDAQTARMIREDISEWERRSQ